MSFFSGASTFTRYKLGGFEADQGFLSLLAARVFGTQRVARKDGYELGWLAGEHIFDNRFNLEKNFVEDVWYFQMRAQSTRVPSELYKAFIAEDLEALAKNNPSGRPSSKQKREAKESAIERLRELAKDGRFQRSKLIPVWFDTRAGEILFGSASSQYQTLFHSLCMDTFGFGFEVKTAGTIALDLVEPEGLENGVRDAKPASFVANTPSTDIAWMPDLFCRDFLGNEFLVWLWYAIGRSGEIEISNQKTPASVFLSKSLHLSVCAGVETITARGDGPANAVTFRAIQLGALPRKAGIMLDHAQRTAQFTLSAESFAIAGLKLPSLEAKEYHARRAERVQQMRTFLEAFDCLYKTFLVSRASNTLWQRELPKIRRWMTREEERKVPA